MCLNLMFPFSFSWILRRKWALFNYWGLKSKKQKKKLIFGQKFKKERDTAVFVVLCKRCLAFSQSTRTHRKGNVGPLLKDRAGPE